MGDERAGVGAAGLDVEHRRLDLDEAALVERAAEAGDHLVADVERPAGLGVDDEVDVALAEAGVGVGQAVPLVGQRAQRLGEQLEAVDLDRQLAGARRHDRAVDADPVAAVELLDRGEPVVADDGLRDEQLDLGAALGDRGEHELAGVALEHDAPGDADLVGRSPCPARGRATAARTAATLWVRSKRYGYGSPPAARMASTWAWRRARSAASPLPAAVSGSSAGRPRSVTSARSTDHRRRTVTASASAATQGAVAAIVAWTSWPRAS